MTKNGWPRDQYSGMGGGRYTGVGGGMYTGTGGGAYTGPGGGLYTGPGGGLYTGPGGGLYTGPGGGLYMVQAEDYTPGLVVAYMLGPEVAFTEVQAEACMQAVAENHIVAIYHPGPYS